MYRHTNIVYYELTSTINGSCYLKKGGNAIIHIHDHKYFKNSKVTKKKNKQM